MRTIDADELKKMFPDKGEGAWTYNITAKAYIDAQPTVDPWHYPSKGELPTETDDYLLIVKQESMRVFAIGGYFVREKEWQYVTCNYEEGCDEPIAWMPLPDPPKEEA